MSNAPQTARGLTSHVGALFAGVFSALILVLALNYSGTPLLFLAYATSLPIFMAGLGAGALASLLATLAGSTSLFITVHANIALIYAFLYGIPAVGLSALALRYRIGNDGKTYWCPIGYLIAALPFYAAILFAALSGLTLMQGNIPVDMTQEALRAVVSQMEEAAKTSKTQIDLTLIKNSIESTAFFMPSLIGTAWVCITSLCLLAAQRILKKRKWNLRDSFELREMRMPAWLVYITLGLAIATALLRDPYLYYAYNMTLLFSLPYLLTGIAIAHALTSLMNKASVLALIVFYIALTIMPVFMLLVILLGIADQWLDFRHRWAGKPSHGTR
ncbi:MAG: DUF2232 domain-containing protein [Bdellovibrionales bacterium]